MKRIIKEIKAEAKGYFDGASGCHDWTHVERVRNLAMTIGEKEKADPFILEAASFLHDICRKEEILSKGRFCHAERGKKTAKKILEKYNIDKQKVNDILHCILSHRYRNSHKPETIEAKCLFDADKLDSIGAIGVARDFLFAGHSGSNTLYTGNEKKLSKSKIDHSFSEEDSAILEWEIKLKFIKNKMLTKTGKKLAKSRHRYMSDFFKEFWMEVAGKK